MLAYCRKRGRGGGGLVFWPIYKNRISWQFLKSDHVLCFLYSIIRQSGIRYTMRPIARYFTACKFTERPQFVPGQPVLWHFIQCPFFLRYIVKIYILDIYHHEHASRTTQRHLFLEISLTKFPLYVVFMNYNHSDVMYDSNGLIIYSLFCPLTFSQMRVIYSFI
jgi:hypothetical protein